MSQSLGVMAHGEALGRDCYLTQSPAWLHLAAGAFLINTLHCKVGIKIRKVNKLETDGETWEGDGRYQGGVTRD